MLGLIVRKRQKMSNKDSLLEQAAMSAAGLQQPHVIGILVLIVIVVAGVAVAAIGALIATTVRDSADPVIQSQGVLIAESYLEEALLKAYDNPDGVVGPCGASRDLWDSLLDYACLPGIPMDFVNASMRAPWSFIRNTDDRYSIIGYAMLPPEALQFHPQ